MTQSTTKPFADFSDWQGEPILSEDPVIKQKAMDQASEDAAIASAEKAMKEAPAVKAVKAKLVKPKAARKATKGKAGRIVGISADENVFLKALLLDIIADHSYDEFIEKNQAAYDKLVARYNK